MMLFGGLVGDEAVDFVDTDSYWNAKGGKPAEEKLIEEVSKPEVKEGAPAKAAEIRKLMAIRTLGEMKAEKALPALEAASKSDERFVATFAKEAIAAIKGEAMVYSKPDGGDVKDINMMPENTGVFAHTKIAGAPAVDLEAEIKKALPKEMQMGIDEGLKEMQSGLIKGLEQMGNIRLDSISVGVANDVGDDSGWVVISLRGEYDHKAVMAFINQEAGGDLPKVKHGGLEFLQLEDTMLACFVSDQQAIFMAGPEQDVLPAEFVGKRISEGAKEPAMNKELLEVIGKTEKTGGLWAAALVTGKMKEVPHLQAFKNLRFETAQENGTTELLLIGEGKDGNQVQQALAAMEEMHAAFVDKELVEMKAHMPESAKPLIDFLEGIEFRGNGDLAIVSGSIKEFNPIAVMSSYFMFGVRRNIEFEEDFE